MTAPDPAASRFGTDAFYASIGRAFVAMCAVPPVLFAIEFVDTRLGGAFEQAGGIIPRSPAGLDGIALAPLIHGDYAHVLGNSVPLMLMGTFLLAAGTLRFVLSTLLIAVVAGAGVWFTGDPGTVVVGASGVVFGYLAVLLARGVVEHSWWNIAVGLLIGLLYGWQLIGVLPLDERISWQGHLFGFIGGLVASVVFRRRREERDETVLSGSMEES